LREVKGTRHLPSLPQIPSTNPVTLGLTSKNILNIREKTMRRKQESSQPQEWRSLFQGNPLGPLCLYFTGAGLSALEFDCPAPGTAGPSPPPSLLPMIDAVKKELAAYFAGVPTDFAALPLDLQGTPFQLRVWQELRRIPRGATISYRELAARVGRPKAARAVGQANAVNPIPLIIPCHRVINADGSLGGYSSGLDRKRWLLRHEAVR
jgi:methylated-DNA-[protein]-cysteine S-methyltransferase